MASVAIYSSRSRANERVGRLKRDMDRSSGYTLSNLSESSLMGKYSSSSSSMSSSILSPTSSISMTSSSVTRRPQRDSSIGALGRSNRESSLSRVGSIRLRDNSLPRMREVALPPLTSSPTQTSSNRYSVVMPLENGLGTETARYARENAIKEIHNNFMKSYKDTNDKINNRNVDDTGERRSKSYAKIMGVTTTVNDYLSEEEIKKHCISEMFMETGRFSTKTLAAVTSLEKFDNSKKKNYTWRKEMEEYETSGQMERDRRARNIANSVGRRDVLDTPRKREMPDNDDGDIWAVKKVPRKPDPVETPRPAQIQRVEAPVRRVEVKQAEAPAPKPVVVALKPAAVVPKPAPVASTTKPVAVESTPAPATAAPKPTMTTPATKPADQGAPAEKKTVIPVGKQSAAAQLRAQNKTERQQLLEQLQQQKKEEQQRHERMRKQEQQQREENGESNPEEAKPVESSEASDQTVDGESPAKPGDEDGMRKMRNELFANMSSLDEEFEAGRSKLAKLRERIRKAKGVVQDVDATLQSSS